MTKCYRFNDYTKIRSQAIYETKQWTGLKILTPKQMLQRLPITLAKAKAGHNSRKFIKWNRRNFLFFVSKEITKKVYNNISKSIQI